MIFFPYQLQAPFFLILFGIILSLVFETAGAPEGFRRRGQKGYLSLISGLVIACVYYFLQQGAPTNSQEDGFLFDVLAKSAMIAISVLAFLTLGLISTVTQDNFSLRGEIYTLHLITYFLFLLACSSNDLLVTSCALFGSLISQTGMTASQQDTPLRHEVVLKMIFFFFFLLLLLAFALIFFDVAQGSMTPNAHVLFIAVVFVLLLSFMGVPPLHAFRADMLDGAPPFTSAFLSGGTLIVSGVVIYRLLGKSYFPQYSDNLNFLVLAFAVSSLSVSAIFAIDQTKISRVSTYLILSQSGLLFLLASAHLKQGIALPEYFYGYLFTHLALGIAGIYATINLWRTSLRRFNTWEDFSGFGRQHPYVASAFLFLLASASGLPFTTGFTLRIELIRSVGEEFRFFVICLILTSTILCLLSVFRLLVFFFGKMHTREVEKSLSQSNRYLLFFCAAAHFLLALAPEDILTFLFVG